MIDCTSWIACGEDRGLVGERNAGIDVEHMRTSLDLGERIGLDAAVITARHFCREHLAPGRIDALADDDERSIEADTHFLGGRTEQRVCHFDLLQISAVAPYKII